MKKIVSIIVPGFNEEKNIGRVIKDCLKLRKYFPVEIIAVESGSRDKTAQVAEKAGAKRVLSFPDKRGKGADFWVAGIVSTGDYIVQIDADYQFQPYEIPLFVKELDKGADVVIGTRFAGG
ncbi:MAG: glycosyltransferase family 2 protein, partial [Candidatus Hodarchaeota archaeon]